MADNEFILPSFLDNQSFGDIMQRMIEQLPDFFDKTEGGYVWDLLAPVATEKAQIAEFVLPEAIKQVFPIYAYGQSLDYLGEVRGVIRKEAVKATGTITLESADEVEIPVGTQISTTGAVGEETVVFETTTDVTLAGNTPTDIAIIALEAGFNGNLPPGSLTMLIDDIGDITSITQAEATTGGADLEDDDEYRQRIIDYDQSQGESFVGSVADYKRWATEVSGVGSATVVPTSDNTGLVKIILIDQEGNPASSALCETVYNHIMSPDDVMARLAPINANLSVIPPQTLDLLISATVVLANNTSLQQAKDRFITNLVAYFPQCVDDGEVKYSKICDCLMHAEGVLDYSDLLLNSGTANLPLGNDILPQVSESDVVLE